MIPRAPHLRLLPPRVKPRAVTLVECLLALTILSFAVLAVTYAAVSGQQQARSADEEARAVRLARNLMEEILSKSYADPAGPGVLGPDSGETARLQYDDVDDYHNYNEAAGTLKDFTGAACAAADQAYARSVTVTAGSILVAGLGVSVPGVTVTVSVRKTGGERCDVTRFIPGP